MQVRAHHLATAGLLGLQVLPLGKAVLPCPLVPDLRELGGRALRMEVAHQPEVGRLFPWVGGPRVVVLERIQEVHHLQEMAWGPWGLFLWEERLFLLLRLEQGW